MIELYAKGFQDRSDRVRWLLEEINIPYRNHILNKAAGELLSPAYLKINPMGRVPTIIDGDVKIFESVGICLYLADKYSYGHLAPKMEDIQLRAEYLQWMVFSVGSLEAVVAHMFSHMNTPEQEEITRTYVKEQCEIFAKVLNPVLSKQDYILSSGFSAADIMLAAVIPGAQEYLIDNNPPLERYMERMKSRDAAIRAKVFE
jgi:glutathione S-transferase